MRKTNFFKSVVVSSTMVAVVAFAASCQKNDGSSSSSSDDEDTVVEFYPTYQYLTMIDPSSSTPFTYGETAHDYLMGSYVDSSERSPETVNFVGYVKANGNVYVSIGTPGVAGYVVAGDDFEEDMQALLTREGFGGEPWDYVSLDCSAAYMSADGVGSGFSSSATSSSGIGYPLTAHKARIAVYESVSAPFNMVAHNPSKVITTDLIGQAYGRYLSNPYSTIVTDSNEEYVYVFSPAVTRRYNDVRTTDNADSTETLKEYETNDYADATGREVRKAAKGATAGVIRINTSDNSIDTAWGDSGVVDLETALGGCTFSRVWHIADSNKYLIRALDADCTVALGYFYAFHKSTPTDTRFFIFDADSGSLSAITGLPTASDLLETSNTIGEPLCLADNIYIPYSLKDESCVYVVDVASLSGKKGISCDAAYIYGMGKLADDSSNERFVLATRASSDGAFYYISVEDVASGTVSMKGNGVEVNNGQIIHFIDDEYLFTIYEAGGSDGTQVNGYTLDLTASGELNPLMGAGYWVTTGYHSYGDMDGHFAYVRWETNSTTETPRTYPVVEE